MLERLITECGVFFQFQFAPYPAVPASYIAADGDQRVACPSQFMAQLASRHTPHNVFMYVFEHMKLDCDASFSLRVLPWWKPRSSLKGCGWASHGADVQFVFNTVSLACRRPALCFLL